MTTIDVNAELFRQLSIIATDENLMQRALKAIKRIAASKKEDTIATSTIMSGVESGLNEVAKGEIRSLDDFLNEIRHEG